MDDMGGTGFYTLLAQTALLEVDIREIVLYSYRLELALLLALAATDTCCLAGLHCHRSLVLVHAAHIDAATLRTFLAKLDDVTWTCLDAGSTGNALLLINLGDARLGIDVDGIELAGGNTVATTQTAEAATSFASTAGMNGGTRLQTVVLGYLRT